MHAGDSGIAVADVQSRLAALGIDSGDPPGVFGPSTEKAVRDLQNQRGLHVDGICGHETWSALVEAGYKLGDRYLYRRTPMLRGDDVAELQRRLSALGFDTGRVDGIFGDLTMAALAEFQQNAGLPSDGILGQETLVALVRLTPRHEVSELVSTVRDRERLRNAPRSLADRRLALGEGGGLDVITAAVQRGLGGTGATVVRLHHPDSSRLAAAANATRADVFVGFLVDPARTSCTTAFYGGYRYESTGGRRLAELLQERVPATLGLADGGTRRMTLPVLRETRMPAVVVEMGAPARVTERVALLARAVAEALRTWAVTTWD